MDTKSRKSNKPLFITAFVVCVLSFLTSVIGFLGAMLVNVLGGYERLQIAGSEYMDEYWRGMGISPSELEALDHQMTMWIAAALIAGVIALASLIYLVVTVGDRDENGKIELNRFDKIFSEVQIIAIGIIFIYGGTNFAAFAYDAIASIGYREWEYRSSFYGTYGMPLTIILAIVTGLAAAALGLAFALSCIKKVKAGKFTRESLCHWIVSKFYREVYQGGSTMHKAVIIAVLVCLLSATVFLAPVVLVALLVFIPKWVKKYDSIKTGIEEVNKGNLDYKIPLEGEGELDDLARGINEISKATSIAVQNELKNQRMKTDLISNVSHDLKTPLTSMVTYIDLLKTEGLDSANAPEYVDVLEQKTNRLRQLTEDLFEAAKASSGAVPVRMERVDLLSLVNQGLGELNQRVEETGLNFIISAQKDRYFVEADGQLLWRVVENLLGNAMKYSQENTRVYVDIKEQGTQGDPGNLVIMEIKNISKQSLNIDASELMERFKRGDASRTTDGSGLGLAIAKDLIKLMNGWLDLAIDGDLFKAKVMLTAAPSEEPEEKEELAKETALQVSPLAAAEGELAEAEVQAGAPEVMAAKEEGPAESNTI